MYKDENSFIAGNLFILHRSITYALYSQLFPLYFTLDVTFSRSVIG